jgi:hypothetical protein
MLKTASEALLAALARHVASDRALSCRYMLSAKSGEDKGSVRALRRDGAFLLLGSRGEIGFSHCFNLFC